MDRVERDKVLRDARAQTNRVWPVLSSFERFAFENTIPRLIAQVTLLEIALSNPLLICQDCDFSRRHQRNDTPDHVCPELAREALKESTDREARMLTTKPCEFCRMAADIRFKCGHYVCGLCEGRQRDKCNPVVEVFD